MTEGSRAKKVIGAIYSGAAKRLYEPVVVRTAFPLLGGDLNDLVLEQGRRAVAAAEGRPILDMPIGTAYFTLAMAKRHPGLVVGVDIAAGMVRKARDAAAQAGLTNLNAVQGDAHSLPFPSGTFGAILCTNGLQVMPGLRQTLVELARVLDEDGRLYVSTVTLPLGGLLPRDTAERLPTVLKSERELVGALGDEGLQVTSVGKNRLGLLIEATKKA
ncbi:MAG: class I SAM-dependent methyltransferase [Actinomycetota bacterium]|nr:class I SAM-dependent methyltransferase [Actinomycetota bacterium]